jgi:mono/diheme cytochrome c family protein
MLAFCGAALLAVAPGLAFAADSADASNGRYIAETWCARCHAIDPGERASPRPPAPSFWVLSRDPAATSTAIRVLLQTPHKTMPNIRFSPQEVDDLIAYIQGLSRAKR